MSAFLLGGHLSISIFISSAKEIGRRPQNETGIIPNGRTARRREAETKDMDRKLKLDKVIDFGKRFFMEIKLKLKFQ